MRIGMTPVSTIQLVVSFQTKSLGAHSNSFPTEIAPASKPRETPLERLLCRRRRRLRFLLRRLCWSRLLRLRLLGLFLRRVFLRKGLLTQLTHQSLTSARFRIPRRKVENWLGGETRTARTKNLQTKNKTKNGWLGSLFRPLTLYLVLGFPLPTEEPKHVPSLRVCCFGHGDGDVLLRGWVEVSLAGGQPAVLWGSWKKRLKRHSTAPKSILGSAKKRRCSGFSLWNSTQESILENEDAPTWHHRTSVRIQGSRNQPHAVSQVKSIHSS